MNAKQLSEKLYEKSLELTPGSDEKFIKKNDEHVKQLEYLKSIGKLSPNEALEKHRVFVDELLKEMEESKSQGAVPKQKLDKPQTDPKKKILPLNKEEKIIHKHLNNNKLNCTTCRKLITRLITEKTRYEGGREASNHLKSCHGVKLDSAEPKTQAPPTSDVDLEWASSYQNLSFLDPTTSAQSVIGGNFPLLPPPAATPMEMYSLTPIEVDIQDSDNAEFVQPKNPLKRKASPPRDNIQLRNKFQVFTDSETDTPTREINSENEENRSSRQVPPRKATGHKASNLTKNQKGSKENKLIKPPPIVMQSSHGKLRHELLQRQLNEVLSKGYTVKYTKNNVLITASDMEQYKQFKSILEQDGNIQWHTYATKEEKSHAFVAKGLDHEPEIDELKKELTEIYNIDVRKIYPMKTQYRLLYLIVTSAATTLKSLKNVKYLNHVEVTWQLRKKFTEITQCKKCFAWGHSATFCRRIRKCSNCGETHATEEEQCQKAVKCANCNGLHKATDLACEVYKFRVNKLKEMQEKNNRTVPRYTEAPQPQQNIWEIRRQKLKQSQKTVNQYSTDDEFSEDEAAAFPRQKRTTRIRQTQQPRSNEENAQTNVSEFLELSREFKSLGGTLAEAMRFLRDFLSIFRMTKQEDRAFALIQIMTEINKYKF